MDHIVWYKGDSNNVSNSFYIIVKGTASVEVDDEKQSNRRNCNGWYRLWLKQVEVNKLCSLKFFGESALIDGEEALRNATVMVSSDRCDLLQLKRSSFLKLMESNEHTFKDRHNNSQSVIDHIK